MKGIIMKKKYINPQTYNFKLEIAYQVLDGSINNADSGDDEIDYGGGGNGDANSKDRDFFEEGIWLEEMEEQDKKKSLW